VEQTGNVKLIPGEILRDSSVPFDQNPARVTYPNTCMLERRMIVALASVESQCATGQRPCTLHLQRPKIPHTVRGKWHNQHRLNVPRGPVIAKNNNVSRGRA
jgi:hypothetical protein